MQSRRRLFFVQKITAVGGKRRNWEPDVCACDRRTASHIRDTFHPFAVFFQDERIVVVPRITVYFRIVTALPLHAETS